MDSHNTKLTDRTVWYDGDSSFNADDVLPLSTLYDIKYVDQLTNQIRAYNRNVSKEKEIGVKTICNPISTDWTIPKQFQTLDVVDYISRAHAILMEDCCSTELEQRELRLCEELIKFQRLKLFDVLRSIIWIINKLTSSNTVWGVGRGSSVASYVLFIIGVHDVDSFAYGLNIDEFLHE